jgi:hypothetical protein
MDNIIFNPENHQYSVSGEIWPSVTQVLSGMGFIDSTWFTDASRERGTLVHRAIHWHLSGELDEESIDPALMGYFDAFKKFQADTDFEVWDVEKPLANETYRFCGTPDYTGRLKGVSAVIDAKTGIISPAAPLQTAGYEVLIGRSYKRFSLHLRPTGKYKLIEHKDRRDRGIFLSALACFWWKKNNGGK